jgi:hypothetical protein
LHHRVILSRYAAFASKEDTMRIAIFATSIAMIVFAAYGLYVPAVCLAATITAVARW